MHNPILCCLQLLWLFDVFIWIVSHLYRLCSILTNGVCLSCTSGCLQCSNTLCLYCQEGWIQSGGICVQCSSNCLECGVVNYTQVCYVCADGYYMSGGQCLDCVNLDPNASLCAGPYDSPALSPA
jgi:hypothetical protein